MVQCPHLSLTFASTAPLGRLLNATRSAMATAVLPIQLAAAPGPSPARDPSTDDTDVTEQEARTKACPVRYSDVLPGAADAAITESHGRARVWAITGPMCAGKTDAACRLAGMELDAGRRVWIVKPKKDTRDDGGRGRAIVSRSGARSPKPVPVHAVGSVAVLLAKLQKLDKATRPETLFIEEAHFLDDVHLAWKVAQCLQNHVWVVGLNTDFTGKAWASIQEMLPVVNWHAQLFARCSVKGCTARAEWSHRLTKDTAQVVVGYEQYEPRCSDCMPYLVHRDGPMPT